MGEGGRYLIGVRFFVFALANSRSLPPPRTEACAPPLEKTGRVAANLSKHVVILCTFGQAGALSRNISPRCDFSLDVSRVRSRGAFSCFALACRGKTRARRNRYGTCVWVYVCVVSTGA